jgi:hypothetical protein
MRKRVFALGAAALAMGATFAAAGTAGAYTDSYSQHGTSLFGNNYYYYWGQFAQGRICNNQSATNSFHVWLKDAASGITIASDTPQLAPGGCWWIGGYPTWTGDPVQVYASSGSLWTYGTDPIYPN